MSCSIIVSVSFVRLIAACSSDDATSSQQPASSPDSSAAPSETDSATSNPSDAGSNNNTNDGGGGGGGYNPPMNPEDGGWAVSEIIPGNSLKDVTPFGSCDRDDVPPKLCTAYDESGWPMAGLLCKANGITFRYAGVREKGKPFMKTTEFYVVQCPAGTLEKCPLLDAGNGGTIQGVELTIDGYNCSKK